MPEERVSNGSLESEVPLIIKPDAQLTSVVALIYGAPSVALWKR
jgi:hypothetical protein